jgi:hypothetical protein
MSKDLEQLKNKVRTFVQHQAGYELYKNENLTVWCDDTQTIAVVFGPDVQVGIAGFGSDVDAAYKDFERSWNELKGFEWIANNK